MVVMKSVVMIRLMILMVIKVSFNNTEASVKRLQNRQYWSLFVNDKVQYCTAVFRDEQVKSEAASLGRFGGMSNLGCFKL